MKSVNRVTVSRYQMAALIEQVRVAVIHAILLAIVFTSVMPFVWMFFGSFKSYVELTSGESLVPLAWTVDKYRAIIFRANFPQAFWNSTLVSLVVTGCVVLTSAAAAYVFAKYRFWGKEQLFIVILSTMMVPFAVVLVPLYVTIADIGLSNKLGGVIVPVLFSTFGIFLMRQFLEGIPSDLIDAGRIDGASEWWIFSRIIIPAFHGADGGFGRLHLSIQLGQLSVALGGPDKSAVADVAPRPGRAAQPLLGAL